MLPNGIARFVKDTSGVTTLEYALIELIAAVGGIASVIILWDGVGPHYDLIASSLPDL